MRTEKKFYDYSRDGITQGCLTSWMTCRRKSFWFLQGWNADKISTPMTYGTIIHGVLERIYNLIIQKKLTAVPDTKLIKKLTHDVELMWLEENPGANKKAKEELDFCLLIAEATLPEYFKYWWKEDFKKLQWRKLEQEFKIPYTTKDGRKTFIRGKKDGVIGTDVIRLFETKTKSQINVGDMIDTLWFEMQVNLYLWAIKKTYNQVPVGVKYNVIRRTGIQQKVSESKLEYSKRVIDDIKKRPNHYFLRLDIKVTKQEMLAFEKELEDMIVEFMDWCDGKIKTYKNTSACIGKHGRCSFLPLCSKADFGQYKKRKTVFRELEDL